MARTLPRSELKPLRELEEAQAVLEIAPGDLAHALNVDPRTVERWLAGKSYPQHQTRENLGVLLATCEHVRATFSDSETARDWFHSPQIFLGWLSPLEAMRAGRFDRIEGALETLDSGMFV